MFSAVLLVLHLRNIKLSAELDAFHLVPVFPGEEPALDLHLLAWEDTLNFRGFQQPNRKDETNRMIGVRS